MLDKILGSKTRLAIFRQLFVAERPVMRPRDLAAASELTCAPVCRELRKLEGSGLIAVTGRKRMATVQADDSNPFFQPLCELVFREFGYVDALKNAVADNDIFAAYISNGLDHPNKPLTICVVTGQSYREISRRLIPVGNAIGREIIVKIQSREVLLSRQKSSAWHFLKHFEAKKMPCC